VVQKVEYVIVSRIFLSEGCASLGQKSNGDVLVGKLTILLGYSNGVFSKRNSRSISIWQVEKLNL
jgi:hypothetical protein